MKHILSESLFRTSHWRNFLALSFALCFSFQPIYTQWESLSTHSNLRDIQILGDTWYACDYQSGIMSSKNKGAIWDTIPGFTWADKLLIQDGKFLVSGVYNGSFSLNLSLDTTKTWTRMSNIQSPNSILFNDSSIVISEASNPGIVSPIYRSMDLGKTWIPVSFESTEVGETWKMGGTLTTYKGRIFTIIDYKVFVSKDGGISFTKINNGLEGIYDDRFRSSALYSNELGVFVTVLGGEKRGWYKLIGDSWEKQIFTFNYFDSIEDKWKEDIFISQYPIFTAYRAPYLFAIFSDGQFLDFAYSLDQGETWFRFRELDQQPRFGSSNIIDGSIVYYSFLEQGFCRRNLSDAKNHILAQEEDPLIEAFYNDSTISPEEINSMVDLLGAGELEEVLEEFGMDTEEISNAELESFINDYVGGNNNETPISAFSSTQPGSCSYMGMPIWFLNIANLKIFMKDVIFRNKGLGPEVKIAVNYTHTADSSKGIFGKHWRFEYENVLHVYDSAVVIKTGTGANFRFSDNKKITLGGSPLVIPCTNNDALVLHWTGSIWQLEKGMGFEFHKYQTLSGNTYLLESIEDSYGNGISLRYDIQNKLVALNDGAKRQYKITYKENLVDSIVAPDGRYVLFAYNNRQLLNSTIDFNNIETKYEYDSVRNITLVDIADKKTSFAYNFDNDPLGRIASITDPEGRKTLYSGVLADKNTSFTNVVNPDLRTISYEIRKRRVCKLTNTAGETKQIFYNEKGKIDSLIWYDGSSTVFSYDMQGNIISKKDRTNRTRFYSYTPKRKLKMEWNENSDTLYENTYENELIVTTKLIDGQSVKYTYNENGALKTITSQEGNIHQLSYDSFGNLIKYTNPAGNEMSFIFDETGLRTIGRTDFKGNVYGLKYDNNGKLARVTLPNSETIAYDNGCCAQTQITDQNGNSKSVIRDATNRILTKVDAEGNTISLEYDKNGFLSGISTKYGLTKKFTYSKRGKLTMINDGEGAIKYKYSPQNQLTSIIDKKNNETSFTYNKQGKLTEITDAAGKKSILQYNTDGLLEHFTNARKQTTEISYNKMGLASCKHINEIEYVSYQYNKEGKLVSFEDSLGITAMVRNSLGLVSAINFPNGLSVSYTYDANGNVKSINYPNGLTVNNTVNTTNLITEVDWKSGSVLFDYDPRGNTLSESRSNDTETQYAYNKTNTLLEIKHQNTDSIFVSEKAQINNGIINNIEAKVIPEIEKVPPNLYNFASNNLNQITASNLGDIQHFYDGDGNQISSYLDDELVFKASYTHDNRISKVTTESGSTIKISYDGMNYPRKITRDGITNYLYYDHKGRLLFETDGQHNIEKTYIYRGKRLIAFQTSNGKDYFYHSTRHGNIAAISSDNGDIVNAYAYSGHGYLLGKQESIGNRFTFLGAFGALNLSDSYILTGARVYNTALGRFIQRDPLGMITGTNPYLYAANNPIGSIDPMGFDDDEATVNTLDFDMPSDNDYEQAGGSSSIHYKSPSEERSWGDDAREAKKIFDAATNHPITDLLPDCVGNPLSVLKFGEKIYDGDIGDALYQFVPFNNSIDAVKDHAKEVLKRSDPNKFYGINRNQGLGTKSNISCEL